MAITLFVGVAPFAGAATAHADTATGTANNNTIDPVLCFVAPQSIIIEALHQSRTGELTGPNSAASCWARPPSWLTA